MPTQETQVQCLGQEDSLEKKMGNVRKWEMFLINSMTKSATGLLVACNTQEERDELKNALLGLPWWSSG